MKRVLAFAFGLALLGASPLQAQIVCGGPMSCLALSNVWTGSSNTFSGGPVLLSDGNCTTAPGIAFSSDLDTGLCRTAANEAVLVNNNGANFFWFRGANLQIKNTGIVQWDADGTLGGASDLALSRPAAGVLNVTSAGTVNLIVNIVGAPSLTTCGDGALATGSSNTSGRVTGTTQTACTLTFSATFGGNSADCWIANLTANRGFVSAASSTAFTVSGLTAGDDFMYFCVGR